MGHTGGSNSCAPEQVYGGNNGLHLFGTTQGGLITVREECLEPQHRGYRPMFSGRGRWDDKGFCVICRPLQRELGKLCSHLCAVCILSGWADLLQTRADGAALAPVFGERRERTKGGGYNSMRTTQNTESKGNAVIFPPRHHTPSNLSQQVSRSQSPPYPDMQDAKPRAKTQALPRFLQDAGLRGKVGPCTVKGGGTGLEGHRGQGSSSRGSSCNPQRPWEPKVAQSPARMFL